MTNYLRLLKLPAQVQMALKNKEIDMGHARALLSLDSPTQQIKLFKETQKNGYSVRKVEDMVHQMKQVGSAATAPQGRRSQELPAEYNTLRERLSELFQAKVQMTCSPKGKGKISIPFDSEEALERIMRALDNLKA